MSRRRRSRKRPAAGSTGYPWQLPIIPLASPNILVGVDRGVGNFRPGVLAHYTLWNADELFFEKEDPNGK